MIEKEKTLVLAAQGGDREAFGALVERYQNMVYGVCYRMTSDPVEAEDLAHDAFVEAFLKIGQLAAPGKFGGWLRTVALNIGRMWYRKRHPEVGALAAEPDAAEGDDGEYAKVVWALARLKPGQRMALVLHYWEGMSYDEVADFMDVPRGTVMSRLYRARQALKDIVESEMTELEDGMAPDETFKQAIDAELGVLMRAFGERPAAAERLSQILAQDPGRFADLVAGLGPEAVGPLALSLGRLGKEAIDVVVDCAFAAYRVEAQVNALTLLKALVAAGRAQDRAGGEIDRHLHQAQEAYLVLDRLVAGPWPRRAKAELLLELAAAAHDEQQKKWPDEGPGTLLLCALLSYGEEAFPLLMERFWEAEDAQSLWRERWLLYALRRTGPRFCRALINNLRGADARLRDLALAGMEVLEGWPDGTWIDEWPPFRRRLEVRFRGKMTPLTSELMGADPALRGEAAAAVARLIDDADPEVCKRAIRLLGGISLAPYRGLIQQRADAGALPTRLAALRALANAGDRESTALFIAKARSDEAAERRLAVETLGRFKAAGALDLLLERAADKDAKVREAAVIALGEIGGERAEDALKGLISSREKKLQRAAASALYAPPQQGDARFHEEHEPTLLARGVRKKRIKKVTGDAAPFFYHCLAAAVCALPELRAYGEREITYHIGQVDWDYAHTRRHLTVKRIMAREDNIYRFTAVGEAMWRVERFIAEHYPGA